MAARTQTPFDKQRYKINGPWDTHFAITKSNDAADNLAIPSRGLWIQTGGTVTIIAPDGTSVQYTVADKTFLGHVRVLRIASTGTAASGFVGGY